MSLHRINWETNEVCNESCAFCFATFKLPDGVEISRTQVDLRTPLEKVEFHELVRQAVALKITELLFGGGDPFIRRDMLELISHAKSAGLRTIVDTNCLILSTRQGLFEGVIPHIDCLGIPMDGSTEEVNDLVRDKVGAFDKQMRVLSLSTDGTHEVKLNTMVSKVNASDVPDIAEIIGENRVDVWSLDQFIPQGRGAANRERFEISDDDYDRTVERAKDRITQLGLSTKVSGGRYASKTATVLLFSPQGVGYVPVISEKHFIGSLREMDLATIISKATQFDRAKHMERYRGRHVPQKPTD